MRIGLFSGNVNPTIGGGHTIEFEILNSIHQSLTKTKHSFILFSSSGKYSFQEFQNISLQSSFIVRLKNKFFSLITGKNFSNHQIRKIIKQSDIDFMVYLSSWANFELDIPYITIVLDLQHRKQPFFPEVSYNGEWERRENYFGKNLKKAAYVIVGTNVGKEEVMRFYGIDPDRIIIIPHPVAKFNNLNKDSSLNHESLKSLEKEKYLFYPAQYWSHKNHINLLKAFILVKEKYKLDLKLVFSGSDKGNKAHIDAFINDNNLSDSVIQLGFVSIELLQTLYKNAFALTYVTFFGPENLPPLEAFHFKCPVIASAVEGSFEQLKDAVLFVDPADPEDIASKIFLLFSKPECRINLIERGLEIVKLNTGQNFVNELIKVFDKFEPIRQCWK